QHLSSNYRAEDVENEAATEAIYFRFRNGLDLGSMEERRDPQRDCAGFGPRSLGGPRCVGKNWRDSTAGENAFPLGAVVGGTRRDLPRYCRWPLGPCNCRAAQSSAFDRQSRDSTQRWAAAISR